MDSIQVVRRSRLDEVKVNEVFRFLGFKAIWSAYKVSEYSILARTEKRSMKFSFDDQYISKSMLNATKGDRQVEIIKYIN